MSRGEIRPPPCEVCGFSDWPAGGMHAARSIHMRAHERAGDRLLTFKVVGPIGSATLPPGEVPLIPSPPHPPEPSHEDATGHVLRTWDGKPTMALWYPSMGGYVSVAVAVLDDDDCVDVYVWHDGEFPFSGDDPWRGRAPVRLHHCDPEQFVSFGRVLAAFVDEEASDDEGS